MSHDLDLFIEDQINGGYGPILDQLTGDECDLFDDLAFDPNDEPTVEALELIEAEFGA